MIILFLLACTFSGLSGWYLSRTLLFNNSGQYFYKKGFIDGYKRGVYDYSEEMREKCEKIINESDESEERKQKEGRR
mgnify:CR=1 FL=1